MKELSPSVRWKCVIGLIATLLFVGHSSSAQTPEEGWKDVAPAAKVSASMGGGKAPEGFMSDTLRDGSVASRVVGHANLNATFHMQFAWSAFESSWEWSQAQPIEAVDLFVADPPTAHAPTVCVKVLGRDARGQYTVRLYHNENLSWQPAATRWLAEIPTKVIDENQKTGGRAVQEAHSQALAILDRAWDARWKPEMLTFSAPASAKGDDVQP